MSCRCEHPLPHPDEDRRPHACLRCSMSIPPDCYSTDTTIAWFFKRLEEGIFPLKTPPSQRRMYWALVDVCLNRENAGRETFENEYLGRDNLTEAIEEIADGINYLFFDVLKARRVEGEDNDMDVVLQTAHHGVKFFEGLADIKGKRKGAPEIRAVREDA